MITEADLARWRRVVPFGFDKTWINAPAGRLGANEDFGFQLLDNDDLRAALLEEYRPDIYRRARVARQRTCPISELIGPDREDRYLEYKSTMRWDVNKGEKAKYIEDTVVKTIAGFANSPYGGTPCSSASPTTARSTASKTTTPPSPSASYAATATCGASTSRTCSTASARPPPPSSTGSSTPSTAARSLVSPSTPPTTPSTRQRATAKSSGGARR